MADQFFEQFKPHNQPKSAPDDFFSQFSSIDSKPKDITDEAKFQHWYRQLAKEQGLSENPEDQFYDYRSAYKADAKPDKSGHWPSKFKLPGHLNEFVGGYSTITGEPNRNQKQETDVNKLIELGYDPKTAKQLSDKNTKQSFVKSAWDAITTPLTNMPSRIIDEYANQIDKPSLERSPMRARIEGFGAGMLEGGGNLIDEMTSPLGIATIVGPKGLGSAAREIKKGIGAVTETAGRTLKNYPLTGLPGGMFLGRNLAKLERKAYRGLENVGKRMRGDRIKTIDGEIVGPVGAPFEEGQIIKAPEPVAKPAAKIKVRPNRDGTFTNMSTGEILDSSGNPLPIRVGDAITKDSPFFAKNRR